MSRRRYFCYVAVVLISLIIYRKFFQRSDLFIRRPLKRYDYIIVGAGTTGCVLASRISEDPKVSVLLVESGEEFGFLSDVPITPTLMQQGSQDWAFVTEPQKYSSFGMWNQQQRIPRGKGLGGSGKINYLMHGFGLREDFEQWKREGLSGWSYDEMVPYFVKAFGTSGYHCKSGLCTLGRVGKAPMKLHPLELFSELRTALKDSVTANTTFIPPVCTCGSGRRVSTYDAYLEPALGRNNLHVMTKTTAVSIKILKDKAISLYILKNNKHLDNIFVNNEIILSAGAIKTPQLLMLSGIGPENVLNGHRIKVVRHVPGVGKNLFDHMNVPIYVTVEKRVSLTLTKLFSLYTLWDYLWSGSGYLANPPIAGTHLIDNSSAVILFAVGSTDERLLRDVSNYKPKEFRETFSYHNYTRREGFVLLASCLRPRSRGYVSLMTHEIMKPPVIDPRYLHDGYDVKCIIRAMRHAIHITSTPPFLSLGASVRLPRVERCLPMWGASLSDEYLECVARAVAVTGHHAGGTCSSGGAVVDSEFKLKSVRGVRVVDASVLPSPVSLYPSAVLVALAEKSADMIKRDYRNTLLDKQ